MDRCGVDSLLPTIFVPLPQFLGHAASQTFRFRMSGFQFESGAKRLARLAELSLILLRSGLFDQTLRPDGSLQPGLRHPQEASDRFVSSVEVSRGFQILYGLVEAPIRHALFGL